MMNEERKKFHPAYFIKQDLEELELSPVDFAKRSGVSEKQVSDLLNEKISITQAMAEKLSAFFGSSVQLWVGLQADYDGYIARKKRKEEIDSDFQLLMEIEKNFRDKYVASDELKDKTVFVEVARTSLQVGRLSYLQNQDMYVLLKEMRHSSGIDFLKNVWISIADKMAREEDNLLYDEKTLLNMVPTIRSFTNETPNTFYQKLKDCLKKCGIHFEFVPYLSKSNVYGATKWIDGGNSPLIAASNRGHSSDVFWFTLFHEISHVLMGHKKNLLPSTEENKNSEIELSADKKAASLLISDKNWKEFVASPTFSKERVITFAKSEGISPDIVVGRLQKEKRLNPSYLNELKNRYETSDFINPKMEAD